MNQNETENLLKSISSSLEIYCSSEMISGGAKEGFYIATLKAALKKSFEFSQLCLSGKMKESSFFLLANLRGICEDYIDLTFFGQLEAQDRDRIVRALFILSTTNLVRKQAMFLKAVRPYQPMLEELDFPDPALELEVIKTIALKSKLWSFSKSQPIQTLSARARKVGLTDFYEFYYAVTSENVHFSPRTLLRTGWGPKKRSGRNPTSCSYSTTNFGDYYHDLAVSYGLLLFVEMTKSFKLIHTLPDEVIDATQKVEQSLKDTLRWPEPVTFEEYNIKGPGTLLRTILKIKHNNTLD
jgi:Family of unknown function (DUF5677)